MGKRFALVVRLVSGIALLSLMTLGVTGRASAASIIYVNAAAAGANNGTSWTDAYTDLQAALAAAASGDQVWVAQGTYKPTTTTDRTIPFLLKNGVAIYGGFAGTETTLAERNPWAHVSYLSGDIGAPNQNIDNSFNVVESSNTDSTAILDGFRIVGGLANGNPAAFEASYGAGILNVNGSPTLSNLIISGNIATTIGGGMLSYGSVGVVSAPTLNYVFFIQNTSTGDGGGMFNSNSSPILNNVRFSNNIASRDGGGMVNAAGSSPSLTDVSFTANQALMGGAMFNAGVGGPTVFDATFNLNKAKYDGGAVYNVQTGMDMSNSTLNLNTAGRNGGAIINVQSSVNLRNVTIAGNTAMAAGGGLFNTSSSNPAIYQSVFWGNTLNQSMSQLASTPSFTDSIVQGGCPLLASCLNVGSGDPALGPLQQNGGFNPTMALGLGSSAIDKGGVNTACTATDERGVSRPQGAACDMGAYEAHWTIFFSDGANDGTLLESGQGSGVGIWADSAATSLSVGDDAMNRQIRGLLSFDTSSLPDASMIVQGVVAIRKNAITGTDPFLTHGNLTLDVVNPYFGTGVALVPSDFEAAATATAVGAMAPPNPGGWSVGSLNSAGRSAVSTTSTTQVRLRFSTATDGDHVADYVSFYAGGDPAAGNSPLLAIDYYP